jgi:nucleoid DNA-binding protein
MKITQKTLTARISEKTGLTKYKSRKALKTALESMSLALGDGRPVDLGRLGMLKVVDRRPRRRINKNLNHTVTIDHVYKNHPKTVRLLGGKDLSENPLPTIVHKKPAPAVEVPARRRSVAIAFPAWRRRFR